MKSRKYFLIFPKDYNRHLWYWFCYDYLTDRIKNTNRELVIEETFDRLLALYTIKKLIDAF